MINSQLYDEILVVARRAGDTNLRAVIPGELRRMIQSWENGPFHPWFLETISSDIDTTADVQTVALPLDYLLLVEDTKVWCIDSEGTRTKLTRAYHEDLEEEFNGIDSALPKAFDFFGGNVWLGPVPNAVYEIRFKYFAKQTPPPDDGATVTNKWALNAEDYFVTSAAARLQANYIKDQKRTAELKETAANLRKELYHYNEARKHVEMDYAVNS